MFFCIWSSSIHSLLIIIIHIIILSIIFSHFWPYKSLFPSKSVNFHTWAIQNGHSFRVLKFLIPVFSVFSLSGWFREPDLGDTNVAHLYNIRSSLSRRLTARGARESRMSRIEERMKNERARINIIINIKYMAHNHTILLWPIRLIQSPLYMLIDFIQQHISQKEWFEPFDVISSLLHPKICHSESFRRFEKEPLTRFYCFVRRFVHLIQIIWIELLGCSWWENAIEFLRLWKVEN